MKDLYIRSVIGEEEMLTDYEASRKNVVNGDKTINVKVTKTEGNKHSYSLIRNQNIFIYEDEEYIIKTFSQRTTGNTTTVSCGAIHRMFEDLLHSRIYDQISGTFRIHDMLDFSLKNSGYTYAVDTTDLPLSVEVENFGDGNSLILLKSILEKFGAEFEVQGKRIYIAKEIARYTDEQFRYKYNIKDPSQDIDTNSFATYIRGYGKKNEDGSYVVTAEYKSPLADFYGIKHADPIRDDRYTDFTSLFERIKRELHDSIDISIKLTAIDIKELGWQEKRKGDYVWCIIDPFNIDIRIRIVEVEDFSNEHKSAVYTLGVIKRKASDVMANMRTIQHEAKKEISATKAAVTQTKQAVSKVVSDIEAASVNISELKSTIESTSKTVNEHETKIIDLADRVDHLPIYNLKGKKLNALGDSITNGYGTSKTYWQYFCEKYGVTGRNYGINGTCLSGTSNASGESMVTRFSKMNADADVITVFGGTNDWTQNMPLGTFTDRTNSSFYGSLHLLIDGLITKYPTKGILFITPFCFNRAKNTSGFYVKDYVTAIKEVCEYYSISVFDTYTNSGLTTTNTTLRPLIAIDDKHLNEKGHLILSKRLESFLLPLI